MGAQGPEIVVGVGVVESEDQVDERAARGGFGQGADGGARQFGGGAGDRDFSVQGAGQLFIEAGEFACVCGGEGREGCVSASATTTCVSSLSLSSHTLT